MNIQFHDVKDILKKVKQGGGNFSPLEIALAKKCLALYDRLGEINNERNEYFEAIYSATVKFEKATKGTLMHKMAADIARDSKAYFAKAVKLDGQLKEMMDGISKDKD